MATYQSDSKLLNVSDKTAFEKLSDMSRLASLADNSDTVKDVGKVKFDHDSCTFQVNGIGDVKLQITERSLYKFIKLEGVNLPVTLNAVISFDAISENSASLKVMLTIDLPAMLKMMVDGHLKDGVNRVADTLADTINRKT
jgi:hypothetical protein